MPTIEERMERGWAQYGTDFDPTTLQAVDRSILVAYCRGLRVKVTWTDPKGSGETWTRTGTIGSTTGWKPAWLLMHRSSDSGSSDVLGLNDTVVAYWNGRKYVDWAER